MRLLRRRPAPPGADDARALGAANRRILELETDKTILQHKLDRSGGRCGTHAAEIAAAQWGQFRAEQAAAEMHGRLLDVLDQLRDVNGTSRRALPGPDRA